MYNPVTDLQEIMFPKAKQYKRYAASLLMSAPYLVLAVFIMVSGLNMLGYVDDDEFFNIRFFSSLSRTGGIFEKGTTLGVVPSIMLTVVMGQVAKIYTKTAEKATELENHRTKEAHRNSLVLKKFLFNFIFFFAHLFYVAFEKMDIVGLRKELLILGLADEFRRVAVEVVLPLVTQWRSEKKKEPESKPTVAEEEFAEIAKEEYDYFDDYLELVIQYGYITFFAAAFPIGTFFTVIFVSVEARSDMYKIERLCRRPQSFNANDIGIWATVLEVLSYCSVVSNLFFFSFTFDPTGTTQCSEAFSFIGGEHIMMTILLLLRYVISDKPGWVKIFLARLGEHKRRRGILMTCAMKLR